MTAAGARSTAVALRRGADPAAPAPLPSLAGMRFVAALIVFGFHLGVAGLVTDGPAGAAMNWIFGQGTSGFSFFFILSGFVLAWSARVDDTARRFWRRRLARIYPNHVVTWAAAVGGILATGATVTVATALPNLLLVHAWVPDPAIHYGLNTVSWSLGCEVFFYALFPVLHSAFARLPGRALWPAAIAAFSTIWAVPLVVQLLPQHYHYWAIWLFPVARLPEFVAGMLLALIVRAGRWPGLGVWPAASLAAAAIIGCRWLPADIGLVAGAAIPIGLFVAAVGAADSAGRPSPLPRWTIWLAQISFAFYLVHQLALRLVAKVAGADHSTLVEVALAAGAFALAILASWLLYRLVELPGRRLLGPSSQRTTAARSTPPGEESRQSDHGSGTPSRTTDAGMISSDL